VIVALGLIVLVGLVSIALDVQRLDAYERPRTTIGIQEARALRVTSSTQAVTAGAGNAGAQTY